jgi:hypothetical protein
VFVFIFVTSTSGPFSDSSYLSRPWSIEIGNMYAVLMGPFHWNWETSFFTYLDIDVSQPTRGRCRLLHFLSSGSSLWKHTLLSERITIKRDS